MSSVGHTSCEQWHWGVQRRGRTFHGAVSLFEEGWEAETVGTCSVSPFFFFLTITPCLCIFSQDLPSVKRHADLDK